MRVVALVPARAGSTRIPGKNLATLGGHPLVGIAVAGAVHSGCFERVVVSTDSVEIAEVADRYGAEALWRPSDYATATSPDIEWVNHAVKAIRWDGDAFAILRPTSPFRTVRLIERARVLLNVSPNIDSVRAMQPVRERPEKMWRWFREPHSIAWAEPYLPHARGRDLHSQQSSTFEDLYVQNAALEIARVGVLPGSISGRRVAGLLTDGYEGVDLNVPEDLDYAQWLLDTGRVHLPEYLDDHSAVS